MAAAPAAASPKGGEVYLVPYDALMTTVISVTEELDALENALAGLRAWQTEDSANERVSKWSAHQHLFHIALATDLALTNVSALVKANSPRIVHGEEPKALALQVLEAGRYPRGESTAPRMVQPPEEIDRELLRGEYEALESQLEQVRGMADDVAASTGAIRHQQLGALTAAQWLRFARLHGEHHLAIVEDIASA